MHFTYSLSQKIFQRKLRKFTTEQLNRSWTGLSKHSSSAFRYEPYGTHYKRKILSLFITQDFIQGNAEYLVLTGLLTF